MEQQFDAVLHLGPLSAMTTSQLSSAFCSDPAYPFARTPDLMFEDACHEGNLGKEGILAGGRAEEAAAAGSR